MIPPAGTHTRRSGQHVIAHAGVRKGVRALWGLQADTLAAMEAGTVSASEAHGMLTEIHALLGARLGFGPPLSAATVEAMRASTCNDLHGKGA